MPVPAIIFLTLIVMFTIVMGKTRFGRQIYAIAAVAIGGTSLAVGRGTIIGTLVGALIMGFLDNMLGLKGVNSNVQLVVKGLLIIVAVFARAERKSSGIQRPGAAPGRMNTLRTRVFIMDPHHRQ